MLQTKIIIISQLAVEIVWTKEDCYKLCKTMLQTKIIIISQLAVEII